MIYLHQPGLICALGAGSEAIREQLFAGISPGMQSTTAYSQPTALMLGTVTTGLPSLDHAAPEHRSRNNQLLAAAYAQIEATYRIAATGIDPARIAIILGTSTSGISEGETAIAACEASGALPAGFHYGQQELGSPARWLANYLGVTGPAYCISTACSSSAKAMAAGARLLQAGLADLVLTGGVDSLAQFTVAGFSSLESVSAARCLPGSANRCGINIGEGAALFMMSRRSGSVALTGWGESSDGYHISAPDPAGMGARMAISAALARAGRSASEIGYINLHGTATRQNDAMENRVVAELLPGVPASSTKPLTGHTLGAAGAIEAALCWLALTDDAQRLPPHLWDGVADPELPALPLVGEGESSREPLRAALSTSFAFGGNNIALVLERA
ncbi:3-oxoacyl-[acyl-carrier-protein] synthase 2 [Andreprevotia sp. IGB-42]|uniref:beta-ketoacyl-ACP synthase n=1 Tax=Andreprevotia sp. IGB-42 TaxID=2497473 RepID=UPI001357954A|nr:beta-ketoacyl-ACP synthase [Andreprevotia sp. IGB-42]KAF0813791.1 3-oxoacyl-[acyl-carrier-protein] synthase 2 [Andreprevotia sp. IGB-42]